MAAQRHLKTREEREGKKREKLIMCKSVRKSGEKKKGGWRTEIFSERKSFRKAEKSAAFRISKRFAPFKVQFNQYLV